MAGISDAAVPLFVQVRAPAGQFRRAGRAFTKEFTIFADGELAASDLATLVNEPALEVQASGDGESYITLQPVDVPGRGEGDTAVPSYALPDGKLVERLEADIVLVTAERDAALADLSSARAELAIADDGLAAVNERVSSLEQSIASLEDTAKADRERADAAEKDLEELRAQAASKTKSKATPPS